MVGIHYALGYMADLLWAGWFLPDYSSELFVYSGCTAGPFKYCVRGPTVYRCLRIYCISDADLLRARWLHCGPTVYRCFFADLLRIWCGPVDSCGPMHCLYIYIYSVSLRIYCGSAAGPLILAGPLFIGVSLRIYCRSVAGPLFIYSVYLRINCGSAVDDPQKTLINSGPARINGPQQIRSRSAK